MSRDVDASRELQEAVRAAAQARTPLAIRGGGTKHFHTGILQGQPLDVTTHRGIVSYEPTELVVTARGGTALAEIEAALGEKGQMLGFEPPHFGDAATLGGTIACGFSGPRRPYAGAARDFVLGATIINGKGEILRFGGQVMKNVAGYDISRLMVGAFGTLGVLLDVSLKVLPKPARELTLAFEIPTAKAIAVMNAWAGQPLPLSGACHLGDTLYMRLSGSVSGVHAAHGRLGGEFVEKSEEFWRELREHARSFFRDETPLWRLSVPPATAPIDLPGKWCLDWGGAQRWLKSDAAADDIRRAAENAGGNATLFRAAPNQSPLAVPTASALTRLQRNIRQAFDPMGTLNALA
ncbi:MAG TPA: glycolate oxidase subunit GlcE [Candidatus Methylomirabilis sp.]|nr:glycolate oxidase subunit GlcE [Candidatus Methylomirabilis sp.]